MSIHNYNGVRRDHLDSTSSSFLSPFLLLVKVTPLFAYWLQIAPPGGGGWSAVTCSSVDPCCESWQEHGYMGTSTSEAAESRVAELQTNAVVCDLCV